MYIVKAKHIGKWEFKITFSFEKDMRCKHSKTCLRNKENANKIPEIIDPKDRVIKNLPSNTYLIITNPNTKIILISQ